MCGDGWLKELEDETAVPRKYRDAYLRACQIMVGRDPKIDAETAGVSFSDLEQGKGCFEIPLLDQVFKISWPDLKVSQVGKEGEPSYVVQLLLLHYLITSDGISLQGEWASFRDLPDGRIYYPAFRSGSEGWLLARFGRDPASLIRAAAVLGGVRTEMADHAFVFWLLPRLPILLQLWEGDDEFPPEVRLLYDTSASNYLPTEDLAVVARYFSALLVRAI
jgi:hypothetical protein